MRFLSAAVIVGQTLSGKLIRINYNNVLLHEQITYESNASEAVFLSHAAEAGIYRLLALPHLGEVRRKEGVVKGMRDVNDSCLCKACEGFYGPSRVAKAMMVGSICRISRVRGLVKCEEDLVGNPGIRRGS
jgi:hypothetical protein